MRKTLKKLAKSILPLGEDFYRSVYSRDISRRFGNEPDTILYNYICNSIKAQRFLEKKLGPFKVKKGTVIDVVDVVYEESAKNALQGDRDIALILVEEIRKQIKKPNSRFKIMMSDIVMSLHNIIDWWCVRRAHKNMNQVSDFIVENSDSIRSEGKVIELQKYIKDAEKDVQS